MAECPSSTKQALDKLSQQLTCPICLEQYTDPKLLQCFHVFCEKCLKPVTRQTPQGQVVECPNCRQPTSLPQKGVPGLQGAFLIHHLFDIQDILKKVSSPANSKCVKCKKREPICYCGTCGFLCKSCKKPHLEWDELSSHKIISLDHLTEDVTNLVPPVQKVLQCSKHPTKELDLYCETCKEVICRDCILEIHQDHQYHLATDAFPQEKDVLIASIEPAEQQLSSVNKALEGLDTLRGEITKQHQVLKAKIKARMHLIHEALEARQEELIAQLDQMTQQKLKNVAAQQDQLELVATRLKSCCGFLQESLRTGSKVEILAMVKPFLQQVQDVTSTNAESLVPEEQANMEFSSSDTELTRICQQFGKITVHPVCHAKCHAEGIGLHVAVVGETATARVYIVDQKGKEYQRPVEVSCELVSSDGSSQVRGEAKRVRGSQYEISYHPQHRGQRYLHIRVEDKHISGSPFPLSVLNTTPSNIINSVKHPWGLALNNRGHLLVVEQGGHFVSKLSNDNGNDKRSFSSYGSGPDQLNCPCGVALSATGDILVCDQRNHRIHVFSPNGKSLKCVGAYGNRPLQFSYPFGIAVHPHSNKIYVADNCNHRVQILNEDLTFCSKFGSKGSENGQFQYPRAISCDRTGNLYVADTENHRVQVFTAKGEYIRQFGKKGKGRGELDQPRGIAVDCNDIVYVSEFGNDRISLFTREGNFVRSCGMSGTGAGEFNGPSGITVSNDGVVYISDYRNGRVQVF